MAHSDKGGRPKHLNGTTRASELDHWPLPAVANQMYFRNNHATESLELFLTKEAADKGAGNGLILAALGGDILLDVHILEFWTWTTNAGSFLSVAMTRPA